MTVLELIGHLQFRFETTENLEVIITANAGDVTDHYQIWRPVAHVDKIADEIVIMGNEGCIQMKLTVLSPIGKPRG